jgi:hypothetical protein
VVQSGRCTTGHQLCCRVRVTGATEDSCGADEGTILVGVEKCGCSSVAVGLLLGYASVEDAVAKGKGHRRAEMCSSRDAVPAAEHASERALSH